MLCRVACAFLLSNVWTLLCAPPEPKAHFGFEMGTDYKLADYDEIIGYFKKLAASSDRIRLVEYGKTSMGKPSYLALISSPENLKQAERYREMNVRLALGQASEAEAKQISKDGKAIVWIDSGLHATEVAPAQHAPELAYRMITGETDEIRMIRDKVILLQVPVINPDGLDMVAHWYRKNVGTQYELAPVPQLYQKYAGHDNNRDWFMMNLAETRNVSRLLYSEWFPHIVYNQHQTGPFPSRIFVPPYAEPLNPHIPAAVMEGINLIGSAMKERFAREDKPGVLSYHGYDAWWNGGLRSAPAFHNMHGILTETALHVYATPGNYKSSDFPERFTNGMPTKEPTVFYQRPWMGGKWGVRDAIEYMLTADFAILSLAARQPEYYLMKAWQLARESIDAGEKSKPYAYIVPAAQWDSSSAVEMLRRLQIGGVQVERARAAFKAGGRDHAAGTYVLRAGQPFRPYLVDLLEPHRYPELRSGVTGPTKRPYDIAGWTLSMQMGVEVQRVDERFQADLEPVAALEPPQPGLDRRQNSAFLRTAELLSKGERLRWAADGKILLQADSGFDQAPYRLKAPRVGLYEPWSPNMDAGWTQWVLDNYKLPHTLVHNNDMRGDLRSKYDAIILASQSVDSILHGYKSGVTTSRRPGEAPSLQRPEYTGGIGLEGALALDRFVRAGGTLVAFDDAAELPVQLFGLPLRTSSARSDDTGAATTSSFFSPGSILRVTVDNTNPIAFGMPAEAFGFNSGAQAWEVGYAAGYDSSREPVNVIVRYAKENVLASGWLSGERSIAGKPAVVEARLGQGRVVLFGIRPQFRGQTFGTFKLLLNTLYLAAAERKQ